MAYQVPVPQGTVWRLSLARYGCGALGRGALHLQTRVPQPQSPRAESATKPREMTTPRAIQCHRSVCVLLFSGPLKENRQHTGHVVHRVPV
jgi:hypothetical protein